MKRHTIIIAATLLTGGSWGQAGVQGIEQAQALVSEKARREVILVEADGTADTFNKRTFFFCDPSTHKVLAISVADNRAKDVTADKPRQARLDLAFDPAAAAIAEEKALQAAKAYAQANVIGYNRVHALLSRPAAGKAPNWRLRLMEDDISRGSLLVNAATGEIVHYYAPSSNGDSYTANDFFQDVERTFLEIGGELEEFFTGKRTIDR
jgi:hypothetical protein